jgi:HEAT repeat protein
MLKQKNGLGKGVIVLALSGLILILPSCGKSTSERISEIYALKMDPTPENVSELRRLLSEEDVDIRVTALNSIVTLGVDDAAELAVAALNDEAAFVRATAAKLVGDQEDPSLSGFLVPVLRGDPDPLVRKRACQALARTGGDDAGPALLAALHDPDAQVRLEAIRGAKVLAPGEETARLAELLAGDPMWEVRVQAASALRHSGDPVAEKALRAALGDPVEFVRSAAAKALADFKPAPAPEPDSGPRGDTN